MPKPTPTLAMLREKRAEILALAERYGASNVRVFGSVARGDATPDSDIDLLVDFRQGTSLLDHSGLRLDLIDLIKYQVDVVSNHPRLKETFRQTLSREAIPL